MSSSGEEDSRILAQRLFQEQNKNMPIYYPIPRKPQQECQYKQIILLKQQNLFLNIELEKARCCIDKLRRSNGIQLDEIYQLKKILLEKSNKTNPDIESSSGSSSNNKRKSIFNDINYMSNHAIREALKARKVHPLPRSRISLVMKLKNILEEENSSKQNKKKVRFENEYESDDDIAIRTDPSKSRRLTEEELPAVNPN